MLNKQKGNMYPFVTHTWNAIKGKCPHDCEYCYMKVFPQGELRFDEKELKTDLGRNNFIFVGSSCDMFAEAIPKEWIIKILNYCKKFPENTYLFQTKNPMRFVKLRNELISLNCVLGTTMETNRQELLNRYSTAPSITQRSDAMTIKGFRKMITIEPIMDFDVVPFISEIERTNPEFVNIGADSKNHNLPEPSAFKVEILIKELQKFTKSISKENLSRIQTKEEK
jgi:DNA repair photolyase